MYQLGVTCWVTVASPGKTTPYLNPQPGAQLKYNIMLEHTKIHEMLWREELGEMKRRFHVLHRTFPPGTFIIKNRKMKNENRRKSNGRDVHGPCTSRPFDFRSEMGNPK
ncbi:hypothetical protein N1851_033248 [Merluccius polli]|uniref:Uncharacterized protein n=1 Tax=Merluccius polli TaxID=89951 RepID=A0AA47NMW7_MERPO|nr:hypothetical protein N1851_033248 [Merluccius polli]